MSIATIDILGLGAVAVDDLLYVPRFPAPDTKIAVQHRERQCGGLTATALVAAARLGARCAYAGVLGDDELSAFAIERLAAGGVDLTYLLRQPDAQPVHSTIIVDAEQHTRTILAYAGGVTGAHPQHPPAEVIRSARVLFVDHVGLEGMLRAAKIARGAGVPIVSDIERVDSPLAGELLDLVDHVVVSQDFGLHFTGAKDPAEAALRLMSPTREAVVVTCGDAGCWYLDRSAPEPVHLPAFAVETVDTTGCGDVFHGAYAAGLVRGLDLRARVRLASAAAAIKATRTGGQLGIPDLQTVEAFLQRNAR